MLIGGDFNKKAKEVLEIVSKLSKSSKSSLVSVEKLIIKMSLDKNEMRNLLEYLDSKGCLKLETIGGPYLYGEVSITEKGIEQLNEE